MLYILIWMMCILFWMRNECEWRVMWSHVLTSSPDNRLAVAAACGESSTTDWVDNCQLGAEPVKWSTSTLRTVCKIDSWPVVLCEGNFKILQAVPTRGNYSRSSITEKTSDDTKVISDEIVAKINAKPLSTWKLRRTPSTLSTFPRPRQGRGKSWKLLVVCFSWWIIWWWKSWTAWHYLWEVLYACIMYVVQCLLVPDQPIQSCFYVLQSLGPQKRIVFWHVVSLVNSCISDYRMSQNWAICLENVLIGAIFHQ